MRPRLPRIRLRWPPTRRQLKFGLAFAALGAVTTLVMASLPALVLLRYGLISHDDHWAQYDWDEGGTHYGMRRSTLVMCDALQVYPGSHAWSYNGSARREPPSWGAMPAPGAGYTRVDTGATGWPCRALASEAWFHDDPETRASVEELRWNVKLATLNSGRVFMPLRPIWTGIVADTCFYAVLWVVVLLGPGRIRAVNRRRRGLCPKCGYDLRDSPSGACPECGRVIRASHRAAFPA